MSAPKHYLRRQAIRQTWSKSTTNVKFFVGTPCNLEPHNMIPFTCLPKFTHNISLENTKELRSTLQKEADKNKDIILLPQTDSYRSLPQKVKKAWLWAIHNTNATWFLKVDDDMYVNIHKLINQTSTWSTTGFIVRAQSWAKGWGVSRTGKWAEHNYTPKVYPPFPHGGGHIINRNLALYFEKKGDSLFEYQGEDVSLGIWIHESKLPVKRLLIKNTNTENTCSQNTIIISHQLLPTQLKRCHKISG